MRIAFNPSTVAALTTPPNNKDITFDLKGRNIFARGVKFQGTDTNTWRQIKINNVSIGTNILDLRNGSNTTLTNKDGIVTINSTWRPVVDNLTSDSTTSSLSANQGRVLKALIDGKSDSGHNHDGRYVRYYAVTTLDCNNLAAGLTAARVSATNAAHTNNSVYLYISDIGTPFQIQIPDSNVPYIYKRYYSSGKWSGWFKLNAGYADSAGSVAWANITGKPSSYTPSAHTHAWNSLTHSSTTENQAILTNGKANGWKLYTLNISGWNNAANNAHSHANKSVLDGITSGLVSNWNTAYNFVHTITGTDTDNVINKWDEIVNFLAGITEDNKLNTLLNSKLSVYELADKTNVGTIKNNGIYYSTTDASSGTLTNSPFNTGFALINMTSYDGGDDLRRSRLAFNAFGEIKVSDDRGQSNTAETWYNVLTSKNSGISGSTIKLNGTSITVYSSGTADGRYVKKSGDTMTGVLTIDTTNFGTLTIKRNDDANGASIQFRGKSSVYGYIGLNNSTKDKQFLRWNSDISKVYTILDTSSTYTSSGKGVINGTTITQVDNATNATNSTNARKLVNWYSSRPTSLNAQFGDGSLRIFYATSSTTEGKPAEDSHILHLAWDNTGGWDAQLAVHTHSGKVSTRAQSSGTWQPWKTLAFTTDIPSSLKNPHSLTLKANGTTLATYDGSSAKEANFTYANVGAASASHTHSYYAVNENYGGFKKAERLPTSGFYQSYISDKEESGGNAPWKSWMHLINCQHSNTGNNYALQIAASFFDNNIFKIRVTNGSVNTAWRDIIHSGNIGSQSVNYANSAGNSDKVDGYHATSSNKPWGTIPVITTSGWMDIGKHLEFHFDNTTGSDYSTILRCTGNHSNIVNLPSVAGTLALISDIPSSVKNPYSLTTFGVVYDGSSAKVVSPSNFINQLGEGTSVVTDGTMLITSYASNSGFADTNAVNIPYKRKAVHLWEYIKTKTDSLYTVIGHTHDDRYLRLIGGTMTGTINRRSGGSTISGRDHAIIRQTYAPGGSSWNPIACVDTETGTWTLGHLSSGDNDTNFHFCFSTNADYNAGNNNGNYVTLRNRVGTIALTSEIPNKNSWNYDDRYYTKAESNAKYITDISTSVNKLTFTKNGSNIDRTITVNNVQSLGRRSPLTERNAISGIYTYGTYSKENNLAPANYFETLGFGEGTAGTIEIGGSWISNGQLYWRALRDVSDNWFSWKTILDSSNYSGILDSRYYTESEVNSLLFNKLNTSDFNWTNLPGKIVAGSEFNIVNAGFKESMWFNYLPINDRNKTAAVASYIMGNGAKGYASVQASGFIKSGGNVSQLLRADGGVAAFNWSGQSGQPTWLWGGNSQHSYYVYNPSNFRVAYAASAGNADTLDGVHMDWSTNYTEGNYLAIWDNKGNCIRPIPKGSTSVGYASSAGNASTLGGTSLGGLFTAFGNNGHNITATIGGVTKEFLVNYAADSDKLDGKHASDFASAGHNHDGRYVKIWGNVEANFNFPDGEGHSGVYMCHTTKTQSNKPETYGLLTDFSTVNGHLQFFGASSNKIYTRTYWWTGQDNFKYTDWHTLLHTGNSSVSGHTITINGTSTTWSNTWRPLGTGSGDAAAGNHSHKIKINGNEKTIAATGVTDLGNYLTTHQSLSGYVNTISTIGGGNAVTSISKAGNAITVNKGTTFLTSHQSLANYYTKGQVDAKLGKYLPLAGGTMDAGAQIQRTANTGMWYQGRSIALLRETSAHGYHALWSLKTTDGSWDFGEYNSSGWNNIPVLSYVLDSNFDKSSNATTYQIKFPLASGTIALTSNIPNPTDYYWANNKITSSSKIDAQVRVSSLGAGCLTTIANTVMATNWLRATGSTGIYFQDHAGGLYMSDDTWIRTYNSKALQVDNTIRSKDFNTTYIDSNSKWTITSAAKLENSTTLVYGSSTTSNGIESYLRGTTVSIQVRTGTSANYSALYLTSDHIYCNNYCDMKYGAAVSGGSFTVQNKMSAGGYVHSRHNSDDAMLLAGGGWKKLNTLVEYPSDESSRLVKKESDAYELRFVKLVNFNNLIYVDGWIKSAAHGKSFTLDAKFKPYLYNNDRDLLTVIQMGDYDIITINGDGHVSIYTANGGNRRIGFFYTGRA